jgi:parallel beta-helix repeat protein
MNIVSKVSVPTSFLISTSMFSIRSAIVSVCFCLLFFAIQSKAQTFTFYVDSVSGSDSNSGTEAAPWKTIAKVNSTNLLPGQSVGLKSGGLWRETLEVTHSGIEGSPITIGSYGTGALPIIDGSDVLSSGWTAYSGKANVWQHALAPSYVEHVWVFFNGAAGGQNGGNPQSSIANITAPNEWYWDGHSTLYVYSTSNPATAFTGPGIEATTRVGVQASQQSFVTFENLNVRKTSQSCFDLYQLGNGTVTNSTTSYCGKKGIAFYGGSNYATIGGNTVSYSAETGISINDSAYGHVYQNEVSHSGVLQDDQDGIGIVGNAGNNYVYNNYVHDNTDQTGPIGIRGIELDTITYPNVNYVQNNVVTRCNHSGILVQTSTNQQVWNNLSYSNAHGVGGNCCVAGIKDDDGTRNVFYNNTTFGDEFAEMEVTNNGDAGPIVENNIFYASSSGQGAIFTNGTTGTSGTYNYNLVYGISNPLYNFGGSWYTASTFYASTGQGRNDVHANPLFTKSSADFIQYSGFALGTGSPAIGAGTYINGVTAASPVNIGAK